MKRLFFVPAFPTLLLFCNAASAQNTFPASGNVGIGTTSPSFLLDVRGDASINGVRIGIGNTISDTTSTTVGRRALGITPFNGYNTAIGCNSLYGNVSGSANVSVGYKAAFANSSGNGNTVAGAYALWTNATGSENVAIGRNALLSNAYSNYNTAVGASTMVNMTSGYNNVALGSSALYLLRYASENVAIGANALYGISGATLQTLNNVAIGSYALTSVTAATDNVAIGFKAMYLNQTGSQNTVVGEMALDSTVNTSHNSAFGFYSMRHTLTGGSNTAFGSYSLYNNSSGYYNTALGISSLTSNISGFYNTGVGYGASPATGALNNSTAVGYNAATTASNQVRIGNSSVTSIGGYTDWTNVSDGRIKTNVRENVPGLSFINQLRPVTYNLNIDEAEKITGVDKEKPENVIKDKKGIAVNKAAREKKEAVVYSGFIAQEVEKAAQSLQFDFSGVDVPKNKQDLYGLRYAEFVVPLVKAVQELSEQNQELKKEIEMLKAAAPGKNTDIAYETVQLSSATLQQNIPNPVNGTTRIGYTLPDRTSNAQIVVTDAKGTLVKSVPVSSIKGIITFNTTTLAAGIYQYSLVISGIVVQSRQMTIVH